MRLQIKKNGHWGKLGGVTCHDWGNGATGSNARSRPLFKAPEQLRSDGSFEAYRWWRVGSPDEENPDGPGTEDNRGCIYLEFGVTSFSDLL